MIYLIAMRMQTYTDYSLRVLIHAAAKSPQLVTVQETAQAFHISKNHLMKVINELARAGFLSTLRGRNGGFTLARPAAAIKVSEVVRFGEQDAILVECFDVRHNRCVITPACRLKSALWDAEEAFYAVLDRLTVADLFGTPDAILRHLAPAEKSSAA